MSARNKMQVYMLLLSLVISLMCMAIMRPSQRRSETDSPKSMTAAQKLRALENAAPDSPQLSKFIRHEKAAQEANDEAAEALGH